MTTRRLALIISVLFHPIVFSLLLPFTVIFKRSGDIGYSLKWMVFSSGFLLMTMFLYFLIRPKEFFTDFDISKREKRSLFYFLAGISTLAYFITLVVVKGVYFPLAIVALGIVISCVLMEFVNRYVKVSIHTAMSCAYVVTVGILYGWQSFFIIGWIIPVIAWSRLTLQKHTPLEIVSGILLGELVTGATFALGILLH